MICANFSFILRIDVGFLQNLFCYEFQKAKKFFFHFIQRVVEIIVILLQRFSCLLKICFTYRVLIRFQIV